MEDERNTQQHQGGEAQQDAADQVDVKDRGLLDSLLGRKKHDDDQEKKKQTDELATGMEKVTVSEPEKHGHKEEEHEVVGEKKEGLLAKLHRTSSSSSSSSDEEEEAIDENGEIIKRKKKKMGLKEKLKEKLPGHKDGHHTAAPSPAPAPVETHAHHQEEAHRPHVVPTPAPPPPPHDHQHDHGVVVQDDVKTGTPPHAPEEEKKGLLDKIKEKLPGGHNKKPEAAAAAAPAPPVHAPAPAPQAENVSSPDGKEKKGGLLGKIMDKIPGYHKSSAEEADHKADAAGEHRTSS